MFRIRPQACLCVLAAAVFAVGAGKAEQFWIDYEGDDYPENVGWRRHFGDENGPLQGGANRSLDNGVLTLDSLSNIHVFDFYEIDRHVNPDAGETFLAEWRVWVDPRGNPYDTGVVIARDEPAGHVALRFAWSSTTVEPGNVTISLSPQGFHSFLFSSADMESYELFIDGSHVYTGWFESESNLDSFVTFGDGVQGRCSLSQWDYFRFGVVPEPPSTWAVLLGLGALAGLRRTRT